MRFIFTLLIYGYRFLISPLLPVACRFRPTCSEYALEAIQVHGAWRGMRLAVRRVCACHPWGKDGFDPVPEKSDG